MTPNPSIERHTAASRCLPLRANVALTPILEDYAMKRLARFVMLTFAVLVFSACTAEQLSRNLYEGASVHNRSLKSTPLENSKGEPMSNDQYEKERQSSSGARSK
jgi:hypothetical protein